jgi:excisionase family DNA binding protein
MKLLTAEELAAHLGVQPSWVNKAARANRLPHVRIGRYRRFRWPDIEAWLEHQRRGS